MKYRFLSIIFVCTIVLALVPWLAATVGNHGQLRVPPEFTDDSVYYYTRIHSVAEGYPFIGNPYFKEHRNDMATAFFGADWIASAPLLLHIPLIPAIMVDTVIGFALFAGLIILLCQALGIRTWGTALSLSATLACTYWFLERPVSMQIVFPIFLFFLLSYLWWLRYPELYKTRLALIASAVLSFYTYTYLWQIVVIIMGITHIVFLIRERSRLVSLLILDGIVVILAFPLFWYTYLQLHQQWYWQTMLRTGLVATHSFGGAAVIAAVLSMFIGVAMWTLRDDYQARRTDIEFFFIVGVSILIAVFSNVITGKDLESANHFIRFTYVWAALAGSYVVYRHVESQGYDWRAYARANRFTIILLALVIFFSFNAYQTLRGFHFVASPGTLAPQTYTAPLQWLNDNTPTGSVIFADDEFSYYIPLMTHDYVLFQPDGGLYLVSDREVQDRYLTSRMFARLSLSDIERDARLYAGVGNAIDTYKTLNRTTEVCRLFIHTALGCPPLLNTVSYLGVPYFSDMFNRYQDTILAQPENALSSFGVTYIIKDTSLDETMHPEKLSGSSLVATIGRFEIYTLSATGTLAHS